MNFGSPFGKWLLTALCVGVKELDGVGTSYVQATRGLTTSF